MIAEQLPDRVGGASLSVACLTEGTYPFHRGGVSTWCNLLISGLPEVDFHVVAATSQPYGRPRYDLPDNVRTLTQIPLWGASPSDATRRSVTFATLVRQRGNTNEETIEEQFLPPWQTWLRCLLDSRGSPDWMTCGQALVGMARFLRSHDYASIFRSAQVWQDYVDAVRCWYHPGPPDVGQSAHHSLAELGITFAWLAALLRPLAMKLPQVDLCHATVAASISLIGVVTHLEHNTPLLLTEHGVYVRERAINASKDPTLSFFQKAFLIRFAQVTSQLCYQHADVLAPVCSFNAHWEQRLGADPDKVSVIYNAVDTERFVARPKPAETAGIPLVVVVANLTPVKDIATLIRAAAWVRQWVPDVRFWVYGSLTIDPDYVLQCRHLIQTLGLETTVVLHGPHNHPEHVYPLADLSVLCSISEAFPFSVLESMACARPVVATDVGGVAEAVGDTGLIVSPSAPDKLAEAIVSLLSDPARCHALGARARERVLRQFRTHDFLQTHKHLYASLAVRRVTGAPPTAAPMPHRGRR